MSARWWAAVRVGVGVAVLGILAWRVGTEPFVTGLRSVGPGSVAIAVGIGAATTVCAAIRWQAVARGFGVNIALRDAVAAYYRSQFLNSVLPGGVLGDVHRGWAHRTLRSVFWERAIAQVVSVVAGLLVVLVVWPADVRPTTTTLALTTVIAIAAAVSLLAALSLRGVLEVASLPVVIGTSLVATAGHTIVFLVAARAAGVDAAPTTLIPLALAVLVVAAVPLNVAGWGPREGAAAWTFAAVGLGAASGATVAVAFGILSLAATLPGAALLVVRRRPTPDDDPRRSTDREAVAARG